MKKLFFKSIMVLAALTFVWGCGSSSSDDPDPIVPEPTPTPNPTTAWVDVSDAPEWKIDWTSNDQRPDWTTPDPANFETWMILMVRLPEDIANVVTEDDMLAVFIDGECRGVSNLASVIQRDGSEAEQKTYFIVKFYGHAFNGNRQPYTVKFYSSQLHHIFSVDGEDYFVPEGELGIQSDYVPPFLMGASKYPVVMNLLIKFNIIEDESDPFISLPNDMVAVFVGDECRGYQPIGSSKLSSYISVTVYSKQEGEPISLRYYSSRKNAVQTISSDVTTKPGIRMTNANLINSSIQQ